jgi:hypothetical protein
MPKWNVQIFLQGNFKLSQKVMLTQSGTRKLQMLVIDCKNKRDCNVCDPIFSYRWFETRFSLQ